MPEDELDNEGGDAARVEDDLLVETLMGWDGDRCGCIECQCPRFLDGTGPARCPDCAEGNHWASVADRAR